MCSHWNRLVDVNSNEYTQYTIFKIKIENHPKLSTIFSYGIFSNGLKNEFKTAVVNKPSVFEPLKVYFISECWCPNFTRKQFVIFTVWARLFKASLV